MTGAWTLGHMPLNQRAKIFSPYAALKGFENLIKQQEETYEEMPELSEDQYEDLNFAIKCIKAGDYVSIRYYRDFHIRTISGAISRLAVEKKEIFIDSKRLGFEELIEINL